MQSYALATTGSIAGTLVHAADYGVKADGLDASGAANTAAIQQAINDVKALGGGCVLLPPGATVITSPGLELPAQVHLMGMGRRVSTLWLKTGSNCHMIRNHVSTNGTTDPNGMFITISDVALYGNGVGQTGAWSAIYFTTNPVSNTAATADISFDASHRIRDVYVKGCSGDGIYLDGRADNSVSGTKVSTVGGHGINVRFDSTIFGCFVEKAGKSGIHVWGSSTRIIGCKVYACGQDTSSISGVTGTPSQGHGVWVDGAIHEGAIVGCDSQQNAGHSYYLNGSIAWTVSGCNGGDASYSNGSSFVGFCLDGAIGCTVQGAYVQTNGTKALKTTGSANRNSIDIGHQPWTGSSATAAVDSGSVLLANRVVTNGAPYATEQDWAASTVYVTGQVLKRLGFRWRVSADHTSPGTFSIANLQLLSCPFPGQPVTAGEYSVPGGLATGTGQLGTGTLRAYGWYLPHTVTLTRIGAEVTTIGDVGSKFRLGIYADTGFLRPGALLLDAGQIAGDSATVQELTISLTLEPGIYWLAGAAQSVTTTQPTLRTGSPQIPTPLVSAPAAAQSIGGWYHTSTVSGALPSTFTPNGNPGSLPRIHVKAA